MAMTPYNFAMITGLGVRGDPIPFDTDMGEWNTMGLYLLSALVTLLRLWVYAYFLALVLEPIEELPPMVPYSRRYVADALTEVRE
ncbi:hypothetical protein CsSME_00031589 [Camellia sinensis var. sinensis]